MSAWSKDWRDYILAAVLGGALQLLYWLDVYPAVRWEIRTVLVKPSTMTVTLK
jgi:hypothetical protein